MVVDRLKERIKLLTDEVEGYKSGKFGPGLFAFPRPDDNDLNSGGPAPDGGAPFGAEGGGAGSGLGGGGEPELRELFANLELTE